MATEADLEMSWVELPPGPELAIQLALVDWETLPDRELVAAMEAARRQISWTQSKQLTAVRDLAERRYTRDGTGDSDTHRRIASEVSLELTITQGQAEELLWLATDLPDRLPCVWAALQTGQLDYERAKVVADGVASLDDDLARRVDQELIEDAVGSTRTLLRRKVKRAVRAADPDAVAEHTKRAKDERRLEIWDNADNTCDLVGRNMDAGDAHAIFNRLTAAARAMKADGDTRALGQLRLDLLAALARGESLPDAVRHLLTHPADTGGSGTTRRHTDADSGARSGEPAPASAPTPDDLTDVIAAVETLIARALADAADEHLTGLLDRARANGRLDGLTVWIGHAVQAIGDALTGVVDAWCSATGTTPGAHGHHAYRPPAAMKRLIQNRHATCVFPTCHRRSNRCDLDHTIAHDQGGKTCKCNLAPLCRAHHRIIKQHSSWTLVQLFPGLLIWVTPSGTWHIVTPQ
jgi:hypothetical protein